MPNFFSYYFLLWSAYIAILYFYFEKNKYYAKKIWGQKNSITILYIMLIRYGTIGRQILYIYIALFFFALFFSYIIRTKRVRVYITIIILLYSSSLSSSLIILSSSLLYFIPIHSQHQAKPNQNKQFIVTSSIYSYMYYKTCSTCFNSS